MVKEHLDSERGNPLPPYGLLFLISSKGSFIGIIPVRITAFAPVVEHWLEQEIAQWVHHERTTQIARKEGNVLFNDAINTFYIRLYGVRHSLW